MRYLYECKKCNKTITINKPMSESSKEEHCDTCDSVIERIFVAPSIGTNDGFKK